MGSRQPGGFCADHWLHGQTEGRNRGPFMRDNIDAFVANLQEQIFTETLQEALNRYMIARQKKK
jgi:hypothetical protein